MKKMCAALLVSVLCLAALCASDPVEGYWVSIDENGKTTGAWIVSVTDGILYGEMVSLAGMPATQRAEMCKESYKGFPVSGAVNKMTVVGTPWLFGLKRDKEEVWLGGSIIDPENGKMYQAKVIFHAADGKKYKTDTLEMRGEIGLGIGRSQFWKTATQEEALSIK